MGNIHMKTQRSGPLRNIIRPWRYADPQHSKALLTWTTSLLDSKPILLITNANIQSAQPNTKVLLRQWCDVSAGLGLVMCRLHHQAQKWDSKTAANETCTLDQFKHSSWYCQASFVTTPSSPPCLCHCHFPFTIHHSAGLLKCFRCSPLCRALSDCSSRCQPMKLAHTKCAMPFIRLGVIHKDW